MKPQSKPRKETSSLQYLNGKGPSDRRPQNPGTNNKYRGQQKYSQNSRTRSSAMNSRAHSQNRQQPYQKKKVKSVGGRLKFFSSEWSKITNDNFVLNCISGYQIKPFKRVEQSNVHNSIKLSLEDQTRLGLSIQKLIEKGAVKKCEPLKDQFLSLNFLRSKTDGSDRFILNLKGGAYFTW